MLNPYQVLQACSETKSKKEKQAILKENMSKTLSVILKMALDPFSKYLDKKFKFELAEPMEHTEGFEYNWQHALHVVQHLQSGTYKDDKEKAEAIFLASAHLNTEQQDVMLRILHKKIGCGITAKLLDENIKDIPTFSVQEPMPFDEEAVKYPVWVEPHYKGVRCVVIVERNNVKYYEPNGKEFKGTKTFDKEFLAIANKANLMFDCIITDVKIKKKDKKKIIKGRCRIIDMMPIGAFKRSKCTVDQNDRIGLCREYYFASDRKTNDIRLVKGKLCNNIGDVKKQLKKALKSKYAGVLVKDLNAPYIFKRNKAWMVLNGTA